jgi:hypothetical protein
MAKPKARNNHFGNAVRPWPAPCVAGVTVRQARNKKLKHVRAKMKITKVTR